MKNIKLVLEYDGTNYAGWQKQNSVVTIQGTVENAIEKLTNEKVEVIGCSRTDSKVHAKEYVCNFKTNSKIPSEKFIEALNDKLPEDIVILSSMKVSDEFHARYCSKGKTYCYTILNFPVRSAIDRNYVYHYKGDLDVELMKKAGQEFIGTFDFTSFKNTGSSVKTSVRTINNLKIEKNQQYIRIYISADGFLYNMARIIVGTLIDVGCKKIEPMDINKIIVAKDRRKAGKSAPPQGLCLVKVHY